jgi:hypothetical protein
VIHDLSDATKHGLDLAALAGVVVAGVTLANAALFMSFLAALCSVIWFGVRIFDRIKYGPGIND